MNRYEDEIKKAKQRVWIAGIVSTLLIVIHVLLSKGL
jgi:hypothetical protein